MKELPTPTFDLSPRMRGLPALLRKPLRKAGAALAHARPIAVATELPPASPVTLPAAPVLVEAMLVGLLGYGVSLVLFVLALRGLGTARTGAYFSTAPFLGAAIAVFALGEHAAPLFWLAAALMATGVWLHLTERHEHTHTHETMTHTHRHVHDVHHQHTHDFPWDGRELHSHEHALAPITHCHPHYPDIHHRHRHDRAA